MCDLGSHRGPEIWSSREISSSAASAGTTRCHLATFGWRESGENRTTEASFLKKRIENQNLWQKKEVVWSWSKSQVSEVALSGCDGLQKYLSTAGCWLTYCRFHGLCLTSARVVLCCVSWLHAIGLGYTKACSSGLATPLHFNWKTLQIEAICCLRLELPVQNCNFFFKYLLDKYLKYSLTFVVHVQQTFPNCIFK